MGLANVKKILAVKTPGGGGSSGGVPGGGGSPSFRSPIPSRPSRSIADGGMAAQTATDPAAAIKQGMIEALTEAPPVLVIEDVTMKQTQQDSISQVATI